MVCGELDLIIAERMDKMLKTRCLFLIFCILVLVFAFPHTTLAVDSGYEIEVTKTVYLEDYQLRVAVLIDDSEVYLANFDVEFENGWGKFIVGRNSMKMGPGYFSQLMLSDNSYAMDMIYHEKDYNLFGFPYEGEQLIAFLDNDINDSKRLFIHRVSNDTIIPGMEIALSEALMAYKEVNPLYYFPLPYWPYYLTKKLSGIGDEYDLYNDNYIGLDFTYRFNNGAKIYGEMLVDEYPMLSTHKHPDKRANLLGIYYPIKEDLELRTEYSNVYSYTYLFRYPEGNYTYLGKSIGHWLGSDGDVFDIEVKKTFDDDLSTYLGYRYIRHGAIS